MSIFILKIFLVPLLGLMVCLVGEILCRKELNKHSLESSIFTYHFKFYCIHKFLKGKKFLPLGPLMLEMGGIVIVLVWLSLVVKRYF